MKGLVNVQQWAILFHLCLWGKKGEGVGWKVEWWKNVFELYSFFFCIVEVRMAKEGADCVRMYIHVHEWPTLSLCILERSRFKIFHWRPAIPIQIFRGASGQYNKAVHNSPYNSSYRSTPYSLANTFTSLTQQHADWVTPAFSMVTRYDTLVCAWGHKPGVAWSHTTWPTFR